MARRIKATLGPGPLRPASPRERFTRRIREITSLASPSEVKKNFLSGLGDIRAELLVFYVPRTRPLRVNAETFTHSDRDLECNAYLPGLAFAGNDLAAPAGSDAKANDTELLRLTVPRFFPLAFPRYIHLLVGSIHRRPDLKRLPWSKVICCVVS